MALKKKFNDLYVLNAINDHVNKIKEAIILRLARIGEQFIKNARENGTYTDRTGNLRNSIGYVILVDGQEHLSSFPGADGIGKQTGRSIAEEAAQNFPTGIVLIVVAGMGYAAAVESKNYDVLTGSSVIAKEALEQSLQELRDKLS